MSCVRPEQRFNFLFNFFLLCMCVCGCKRRMEAGLARHGRRMFVVFCQGCGLSGGIWVGGRCRNCFARLNPTLRHLPTTPPLPRGLNGKGGEDD